MSFRDTSREIEDYVASVFEQNKDPKLLYHNFHHTSKVVQRAVEIASFYKIDEESLFVLVAAGWFHDIGYLFVGPRNHEQEGVKMMITFLARYEYSPAMLETITRVIMATKEPVHPLLLPEKILCDADTYHFGTAEFKSSDDLVKKEIELVTGSIPEHWIERSIAMLKNHRFHTSYCTERLEPGKMRNIAWLESLLRERDE
jgi:HD superfamily phosphodiesterase